MSVGSVDEQQQQHIAGDVQKAEKWERTIVGAGWLINYIENLFKTFVDITTLSTLLNFLSIYYVTESQFEICNTSSLQVSGDRIVTASFNPIERYGIVYTFFLYLLRFLSLLVLPQCICNSLGLILFNSFKDRIKLKTSPLLAPFICFRVVTKGDYPELVKTNLEKNLQISRPPSIQSRALQYCLEDEVNILRDEDWIVHLDEETLLSINSLNGILNFCEDGRHQFGQGVITYAQGEIVNWITTLSDSFRVADDMGKLRFQFKIFHKPLFGWKGSFVVTNAGAEKKVLLTTAPRAQLRRIAFSA
uniref:Glyco_trans_2-like domain-containing protein n=1 Tax=Globodera pallida TaxID=36090 RepID=A0A183CP21_GLOPA